MENFAVYRLPYQDHCTLLRQMHGEPEKVTVNSLTNREGFVIAPFNEDDSCPAVLLKPDEVRQMEIRDVASPARCTMPGDMGQKEEYADDFARFHDKLSECSFKKIVLARTKVVGNPGNINPEDLFMMACRKYPRMFIALVSTSLTGTWLVATPEVILESMDDCWHTMALAGTMKLSGDMLDKKLEDIQWSEKNRKEQFLVSEYIRKIIMENRCSYRKNDPYTVRAADLVHLRNDFFFRFSGEEKVGDILSALHPTPAVCGLPMQQTRSFILANERQPRKYYSGFMGPLSPHGGTHLYVSLRCMEITDDSFCLYAGGGLVRESQMESEWLETENKTQTMLRLLTGQGQ